MAKTKSTIPKLTKAQKQRGHKTVQFANQLRKLLVEAMPKANVDLLSQTAVDLADLTEVAEDHLKFVKHLKKFKLPKDFKTFDEYFLPKVLVIWLIHGDWHLRSLKRNNNKLWNEMGKSEKLFKRKHGQ